MTIDSNPQDNNPQGNLNSDTKNPINEYPPAYHKQCHRTIYWFTTIIIFFGLIWALLWFFYFRYYESTDDAYANGNMININSAVSGSVVAFYADDTDLVLEGQLLVQLDVTDYQAAYEKELAALATAVLDVRQLFDRLPASSANFAGKQTIFGKAQYDFDNRSKLVGTKAISNEDFTHARDDLRIAEFEMKQADSQLQIALAAAGNTSLEDHPLIEQHKASVRQAYYNLKHCAIYAPTTGYVAQRNVDVGQWVTPTMALMAVIPTDYVWVDANFKETQLSSMRVGQPAEVSFDMYGSRVVYKGKVIGIASGSGSVFSLIPPQNATGNWIKIVQRLPVRISLDPEKVKEFPVRLGISAEVSVEIVNQNLPRLTQIPPKRAVAKTTVFDIHLAEVDKIIDEVIKANN